jgi:hypothetical protein
MVMRLASTPRRSRFVELLEDLGFGMTANTESARHRLIRPNGLRLVDPVLTGWEPVEGTSYKNPIYDFVEGDHAISWEGWTVEEVPTPDTRDCLWELLNLPQSDSLEVMSFVSRWGLLEEPTASEDEGPFWLRLEEFDSVAESAREFLLLLATTEAQELLPKETLDAFAYLDYEADTQAVRDLIRDEQLPALGFSGFQELSARLLSEARWSRWNAIREQGRGLELQQTLAARALEEMLGTSPARYVWDQAGRRLERIAIGVKEIAWSHLAGLFTSPAVDVFICGMCGNPYPYDSASSERRPRSGVRTFCSEECRKEAKLESNRLSWQKNKNKWRPAKGVRKEDNDGQAS